MPRTPRVGPLARIVGAIAACSSCSWSSAVHLLPRCGTLPRDHHRPHEPVILKSVTELSRYRRQRLVRVRRQPDQRTSLLPSFLAGSETLFIRQGADIAYIDFSGLKSQAIAVNANRTRSPSRCRRPGSSQPC